MQKITEEYLMGFVAERFLTDERYRNGHINILAPKDGTRVLGMHTPEMKKVAKEIVKSEEWQEQIECWQQHKPLCGVGGLTHEERMIWGLVINYVKVPLVQRLQMLDKFIPAVDNWAICDNFCCNAKWVEKEDKEQIWQYIVTLISSEDEFRCRVGLILSLAHYLVDDNLIRTLDTIAGRNYSNSDPYYIRMGVAWLFAEGLCKQYAQTLPYIIEGRLSRWIHNKSIQKARESFRITDTQKHYLNTLKRSK